MTNFTKNIALWIVIALLVVALINLFQGAQQQERDLEMTYSQFMEAVESERVANVTIQGDEVTGELADGRSFKTVVPPNVNLADRLEGRGIQIAAEPEDAGGSGIFRMLLYWLPLLLLIGVWIFFMRQMQGGGRGGAMGFGKSKAKLMTENQKKVVFGDVAGVDEAKGDLQEIVEYLRDPQRFQRLGGEIPKGMLLVGPPGTGKTLLARAVAGEAGVPFFSISGSDFVEMFVGVGASRVRDMFEQGKKNAPCLIFIDELDAVGRQRGAGMGGGNDEREQTLNQLLVEMDGFEANEGVIIIAATNRPDVLDPALTRPGRFDRQVTVPNPDIVGREQILKVHTRKLPLGQDVELRTIARGTPGFSGADLDNLANEAALMAARRGKRVVGMQEFEDAKDKVMMGGERRSMVMTEGEKKLTAYHEGGHAVVAAHQPASDPIHKATIIPRGRALGVVMRLPETDRISMARDKLEADLAVAMGGRVAEELIFGNDKVTTGASSDIKQATDIARRMVTEFGMSEKLGMRAYGDNSSDPFVGAQMGQTKSLSDHTTRLVDEEIDRIIDESYSRAKRILEENIDQLHAVAKALLEYETLSGDEVHKLLRGEEIQREEPDDTKPAGDDGENAGKRRRRSSVPSSRRRRSGGFGPEPQGG